MRVAIVVGFLFVLPTAGAAQHRAELVGAPVDAIADTRLSVAVAKEGLRLTSEDTVERPIFTPALRAANAQQTRQPPPPPPPPARRRLGSMVGYIDDGTVGTRVRIRFDAATGNTVPDRAEFFYAKCGCYAELLASNPAFDPDAPGPREGAVNDSDFQQLNVWGEYAFGTRFSVFGQLPVRWFQPQSFIPQTGPGFGDQSGLGDVRGGVKLALAATDTNSLTVQAQMHFPTGDAAKALGTDHASFEPAILYYQELTDLVTLESQLGVLLPIDGSAGVPTSVDDDFAGRVMSYGVGGAFALYRGSTFALAPVVELVGWRVLDGFQTAATRDASGTNIVNLKIGGRLSAEAGHSLYIGYGHALTDATWYDDIVRFEYRYSF